MKRFLQETWELWYWAMFCPTKLKRRINQQTRQDENEDSDTPHLSLDLFISPNTRVSYQFLLLISLFSFAPFLSIVVAFPSSSIAWMLLPAVLFSAFFVGSFSVSLGLNLPLLFLLLYGIKSNAINENLATGIRELWEFSSRTIPRVTERPELLAIFLGSIAFLFISRTVFGFVVSPPQKLEEEMYPLVFAVMVYAASISNAAFITSFLVLMISVGPILDELSFSALVSTSALLGFTCSPFRQREFGLILGFVLMALGVKSLGLGLQALSILPVTLAFYYRVIPEYISSILIIVALELTSFNRVASQASFSHITLKTLISKNYENCLRWLSPFGSELLWFSLPNHEQILARVFQSNPLLGLEALQKMQLSLLPGPRQTATKALPLIVANYLSDFQDSTNFQHLLSNSKAAESNNLLKILLPNFYPFKEEDISLKNSLFPPELLVILPRLREISQDTHAALQANNLALKERGLEAVVHRLESLPSQLPGLGLSEKVIRRWTPVIQRWQRIVGYDLTEQKTLSQGELLNPFQYGNPLQRSRADLFKGRQTFAENIARILLDRNRPTIILHGPRRCGKTSFLNNLPRLLPSQWIPIFVDAQSAAATTDEAGFCQNLVRAIKRDGRVQGLKFPPLPTRTDFLASPYITLEDWLTTTLENLKAIDAEKRLLLTIDEFEKIGTAIDAGKLTTTLFDELRSLIQHWDQLGFVFSGVQTLDELGPNWSSYFISVVPVEMLYLEPDEAQELLTNPDPDFALSYAPGLIDEILHLTQCHPNLLQLIGAALVTEANERHTTTATADMLQAAIPRAFTLGTSYFINVWTEFTGNPANPAEVHTGQNLLKALADGKQPASNNDEQTNALAKAALRRMNRYRVLKLTEGQYEFDIPLIKRWVRERAVLE